MKCAEGLTTQAYIDGEVTGDAAAAAERHIEGCADCQALCADAAAISDDIRRLAPRYRAPAALRGRVMAMLDAEKALPRAPPRGGFWRGAFSGAGITGIAAAIGFLAVLPPSATSLVGAVTDARASALMSGHAIEVASTDHHTVKPWFAGRIALSPPVADFAPQGFKLVGGRLAKVAGTQAAVVVYRHGQHEVELFVWPDRGASLPATGQSHGVHSLFWRQGDLDLAAVSDTAPDELAQFVALVKAQRE